MEHKLRIISTANATWANSGYATIAKILYPRIVKEGYKLASVNFYGQEGGKFEMDGVTEYPKMSSAWGDDALFHHSRDFKADVSFTNQDIWTMNYDLLKGLTRFIPICVDGDTLVSFVDGRKIKIKDVVDNKIQGKVWGYKNGKVVATKIKAWQKIPDKMDVYELKTKASKLLITGNNEVWVQSIIGRASSTSMEQPEWKRTDCIIPNDMVYYLCNEPSKESSNKSNSIISHGSSILRWFNRWRGNCNNNACKKDKSQKWHTSLNSSFSSNNQYRRGNDKVGSGKNWCWNEQSNKKYWKQIQSKFKEINTLSKNLLYGSNMGLQLSSDFGTDITLSFNKKREGGIIDRIYQISSGATEGKIQSSLYSKRSRDLGESPYIEPEIVMAIGKVKSPKRTVYDISTETGNFFANQILIHNCPIDHEPAPPAIVQRLRIAYRIITYSKFGRDMLLREGLYSTYIPCPVETTIFHPLGEEKKMKVRDELGIPRDKFVLGMVSANKDTPPRKSFQEVMDAFVEFKKKVPNAALYLHTLLSGLTGGFPIDEYAKFLNIEKDIFYLQPYDLLFHVDNVKLNEIYNAMDCLVAPSTNEGFGIPIIEAQSAGIPVITNNWTSMPELIKPGITGFLTQVQWKRFSPMLGYVGHPSADSVYNCMLDVYKADRVKMGEQARKYMLEEYDADMVFKRDWIPLLQKIEKEVYP